VILVHQPTEKGVETLANRIRERIANEPFVDGERSLNVTCSLGAAIAIPGRRERNVGERLVAAADQAMYAAKTNGRNRTVVTSLVSEEDRHLQQQVTAHRFSRWLVQKRLLDVPAVSRALLECWGRTIFSAHERLPPPFSSAPLLPLPGRAGLRHRAGHWHLVGQALAVAQVGMVLQDQDQSEDRFGVLAIRRQLLTPAQLVHLLTLQHECPKQLVAAIIRLGLIPPDVATKALEDYSAEQAALLGSSPALVH
ncbi:MAG: hypothetical protein B7Z55_16890, partial [Planctomycetales bacterium 12-60-4]